MNKYNLDKPILFEKPVLISVARAIQQKAWDAATRKISDKEISKHIFVSKIGQSAVGQWMRLEVNAPMLPTDFRSDDTKKPSFPYHSELGKLKDIYVQSSKAPEWYFDTLYSGNSDDVVALTVAKFDNISDGNSVQIYALMPKKSLQQIVEMNAGNCFLTWEDIKKKCK